MKIKILTFRITIKINIECYAREKEKIYDLTCFEKLKMESLQTLKRILKNKSRNTRYINQII